MMNLIFRSVENINDGKFLYSILDFLSPLFLLKSEGVSTYTYFGGWRRKAYKAWLRLGYKTAFLKLDLRSAYRFRIKLFIGIVKGELPGAVAAAKHYLQVMNNEDFLSFLCIDSHLKNYVKTLGGYEFECHLNQADEREVLGKSILIGPSVDPRALDICAYDTVIFIKPPTVQLQLSGKRVLVFLNHAWINNELDSIAEWIEKVPSTTLISPASIPSLGVSRHPAFGEILSGPLGASPMGLQRALIVLLSSFIMSRLELAGFDFSLSKCPYNDTYPSRIWKLGGERDVILWSNSVHDFFYNFLLTRILINANEFIHGDVKYLVNTSSEEIAEMFKITYQ